MNFQRDNSLFVPFICRVISASWDAQMRPKSLRSSLKNQQPCLFLSRPPTPIIYESLSHELNDTGITRLHMIGAF